MTILSDKWQVFAAIQTALDVDPIEPVLIAGAFDLLKQPINVGSAGIDTVYNQENTERISSQGGGSIETIYAKATTVGYDFGFVCWDPATGIPVWDAMAQSAGLERYVTSVGVETRYRLAPQSVDPATFYQFERFLSGSGLEHLITSLNTFGNMSWAGTTVGELVASYAGQGSFQEEWTAAADFLDLAGVPLLLKDGTTAVGAGPNTVDCDQANQSMPNCGVIHQIDGLDYPISAWNLNLNNALTDVDIMNQCPTTVETALDRGGAVTGDFVLHTTDARAAYNDWRAKFPNGTIVSYSTTFVGPNCNIEFLLPQVQLLPKSARNVGVPTTWSIPWKSIESCDGANPELEIVITPNP